jgi:hypothetical protein
MCVFWKVNTVHFEKHVELLKSKHVRVIGVLDYNDRVVMNVYDIKSVNNIVELTYHAMQVKYHALQRVGMREDLPQPMAKSFNKVAESTSKVPIVKPTPCKVEVLDEDRFGVSPAAVKKFITEMRNSKSKKFHYDKVMFVECGDILCHMMCDWLLGDRVDERKQEGNEADGYPDVVRGQYAAVSLDGRSEDHNAMSSGLQ